MKVALFLSSALHTHKTQHSTATKHNTNNTTPTMRRCLGAVKERISLKLRRRCCTTVDSKTTSMPSVKTE